MTATEVMLETEKEILILKADNLFLEMEMRKLLTSLEFVRDIDFNSTPFTKDAVKATANSAIDSHVLHLRNHHNV